MTTRRTPDHAGRGSDVRLVGLTKRFADTVAVDALDLTIERGSFFALIGPSGCGKTTTLRMIGGFEVPTAGQVLVGGNDVTHRKPYRRPVNTVFQNYALFPHLNIFENVAFGLRRTGVEKEPLRRRVGEMLELVQLTDVAKRKPAQLSGGQQQRIALARALINEPQVLLLDEPLGALDLKLRREMQLELKRIQTEVGITFVHVTHDQEEAMTMADTIAVMCRGKVEQLGDPVDLYECPQTEFVANFLGRSNLLTGRVDGHDGDHAIVVTAETKLRIPHERVNGRTEVKVGVRPEKINLVAAGHGEGGNVNSLPAIVTDRSFMGVSTQFQVRTAEGDQLTVFTQNLHGVERFEPGSPVALQWRPEHTFVVR